MKTTHSHIVLAAFFLVVTGCTGAPAGSGPTSPSGPAAVGIVASAGTVAAGRVEAERRTRDRKHHRDPKDCPDGGSPDRRRHHGHESDRPDAKDEDDDRGDSCERPAATNIEVSLAPLAAEVPPGGSLSFTASVTGASDAGVVWSIEEGAAGGSVTPSGLYTAPAAAGTYHLVAASQADPAKIQGATVYVVAAQPVVAQPQPEAQPQPQPVVAQPQPEAQPDPAPAPAASPVAVSLGPPSSTVDACGSVTFRATVTGSGNPAVLWSVREGQAGGTVSQGGVYSAPTTAGTFHVVAASVADPARSAEATVVVGPEKVLSIAVTPGSTSVSATGALAFSAIVTTSCGTFAAQ